MTPELQRFLATLGEDGSLHFLRFVEAIYEARYTGSYTVHNFNGVPQQIDIGAPIRLSIIEGQREGLDRPKPARTG